jgi:hypothetical protein
VAVDGDCLWFGTDEGAALDRLTVTGLDRYGAHASFDLSPLVQPLVPEGGRAEIDFEGLALVEDHLWLVGSHATTRGNPDEDDGPKKVIEKLAKTKPNPARRVLARLPLVDGNGGRGVTLDGAVSLDASQQNSILLDLLAGDPHLRVFLAIPSKDNGLDIEGLAILGQRVFLGLRGPVLRGWAVILELRLEPQGAELRPVPIGPDGRAYRKHFLDLEGCGLRDLCADGGPGLLLLAGPTMALDGTVRVHRWTPPDGEDDTATRPAACPAILEVSSGRGTDRAEGMVLLPPPAGGLLVVYDSPAKDRCHGEGGVDADLFDLRPETRA